jgi:hypothetical protein
MIGRGVFPLAIFPLKVFVLSTRWTLIARNVKLSALSFFRFGKCG